MKLSVHDKNLCALFMVLEIILKSIVDVLTQKMTVVPEWKKLYLKPMLKQWTLVHGQVKKTNDRLSESYKDMFSDEEQDLLVNVCLGICTLIETCTIKQLNIILKSADIDGDKNTNHWLPKRSKG